MPPRRALLLLVVCVVVNLLGRSLVELLHLPVHLDMVGTAIAALALGPWRGAAVGLATNLLGVAESGPVSVPFALVNVAGALVWGYGARRWGLGRSLPRFLGLNVLVPWSARPWPCPSSSGASTAAPATAATWSPTRCSPSGCPRSPRSRSPTCWCRWATR